MEVTGIVLAGGTSSRMGKDKGLCRFGSKLLVEYALESLKPLCNEILISTNNIDGYEKFGYPIVVDKFKKIGPIGGIYSALSESSARHNLVLSCDTPFVTTEILELILSRSAGNEIVVAEHGNKLLEPLVAYYSSDILHVIEEFVSEERYKLMDLFKRVKFSSVTIDVNNGFKPGIFKNLNTPIDLNS